MYLIKIIIIDSPNATYKQIVVTLKWNAYAIA
jgi:hypothetical protein